MYKITAPTGMTYVGATTDLHRRVGQHRRRKQSQKNVSESFLKHGYDAHSIEIIEECDASVLRKREEYWIVKLNTRQPNGMNISEGPGTKGVAMSNELKKIISTSNSKVVYQYDLSGSYVGCHKSAVVAAEKTGANASNIGRCCIGMLGSSGGFLWSMQKKSGIDVPDSVYVQKPFYLFKKSGELVGEYSKFTDCMSLGIIPTNIQRCLIGVRASANGYVAIYKENYTPGMCVFKPKDRPIKNKMSRDVIKMDLDYNEIETYESVTAAAKSEGRSPSDVLKCCNGKLTRSGKNRYKFK